jgi:hypothetical protein
MSEAVLDAEFEEVANQRRGDRRHGCDRRTPRMRLDTLFAATLLAHVAPLPQASVGGYQIAAMRAGLSINLRA